MHQQRLRTQRVSTRASRLTTNLTTAEPTMFSTPNRGDRISASFFVLEINFHSIQQRSQVLQLIAQLQLCCRWSIITRPPTFGWNVRWERQNLHHKLHRRSSTRDRAESSIAVPTNESRWVTKLSFTNPSLSLRENNHRSIALISE